MNSKTTTTNTPVLLQTSDVSDLFLMGVGQFGYVYRATWRQSRGSSSSRNSNCFDETGILERADVETMTAAHNTEHGCPQQHPSVEFVAIKAVCEKMAGNSLDVGDEGVDEMDLDSLCHELDIQSHLQHHYRHPHVASILGWYYEDTMHLSLVLEYAPHGNLVALLRKRGSNGKSNSQWSSLVRCILLQVCQAVAYLQTMQIAHRDIKPENILVHEIVGGDEIVEQAVPRPGWHPRAPILVKLCDFGAAVRWTPDQRQSTLCGTAEYVPPEMVTPSHSTEKCGAISYSAEYVDPWMLGVLAYELRNATTPFCPTLYERVTALSEDELYDAIYAKIRNFTRLVATSTSSSEAFFHDFVCRLLQVDPQKRMTAKETIGHCYFEQKPANALSPYTGSPAVPTFAAMEKNPASTAVAKRRPFFDSLGPVCGCAVERQVSSAR